MNKNAYNLTFKGQCIPFLEDVTFFKGVMRDRLCRLGFSMLA